MHKCQSFSVFCNIIIADTCLISRVFVYTVDCIIYSIVLKRVISKNHITLVQNFLLHLNIKFFRLVFIGRCQPDGVAILFTKYIIIQITEVVAH
jgi:hypothetical protein